MAKEYPLIPLLDIPDAAREIAVAWVGNYEPAGFDLENKHKLASDIMNYAKEVAIDFGLFILTQAQDKNVDLFARFTEGNIFEVYLQSKK